ncbi:phenylacetate--CoA ligase family protein, partial [Thermodesulfobacteriota bacterium]
MAEYPTFWNSKQETLSAKEYRLVQEKAFLNELNYVWKNSAFYLQKFTEAGLGQNDIKDLDDLHRLPFTEKTELRDSQINHPPLGSHAIVPLEKVSRVYSTSGTTGRPTYIGLTQHDIKIWRESASRALWTGGFRPKSIVPLIVAPYPAYLFVLVKCFMYCS